MVKMKTQDKGTRQKKGGKFHTWGCPEKKNLKNKVVFKMNFQPFQAILDHVFFQLFWVGTPEKNFKKVEKNIV